MTDAEDAARVAKAVDIICQQLADIAAIHPKHWRPHIKRGRECWSQLGNAIWVAAHSEGEV